MEITSKQSNLVVIEQGEQSLRKVTSKVVEFDGLATMSGSVTIKDKSIDIRLNSAEVMDIDSASATIIFALKVIEPYLQQIMLSNGKTIESNNQLTE